MNETGDGGSNGSEARTTEDSAVERSMSVAGIPLPWFITIVAAVLLFVISANPYSFGVFFKPISDEFGWSRGVFSGAFALRSIIAALVVAPIGYWSDVSGPRRPLLFSFFLTGAGFLLISRVTEIWQMYLVQGVVMGAGAAVTWSCLGVAVSRWHDRSRVAAMSAWALGGGLGGVAFPWIAQKLILSYGWQKADLALGVATLVVGMGGALLIKHPPSRRSTDAVSPGGSGKGVFFAWKALPRMLTVGDFRPLFFMFLLFNLAGWLVMTHLVNYLTDSGFDALTAAGILSLVGLGSLFGRLATGLVGDRLGARMDAAWCFGLITISTMFILLLKSSTVMMWVAAFLAGIGWGGAIPLVPSLVAEHFGTKHLGAVSGVASIGILGGAALGPWLAGFVFDVSDSYTIALLFAAACGLTAFLLALSIRPTSEETRGKTDVLLE